MGLVWCSNWKVQMGTTGSSAVHWFPPAHAGIWPRKTSQSNRLPSSSVVRWCQRLWRLVNAFFLFSLFSHSLSLFLSYSSIKTLNASLYSCFQIPLYQVSVVQLHRLLQTLTFLGVFFLPMDNLQAIFWMVQTKEWISWLPICKQKSPHFVSFVAKQFVCLPM